MKIKKSILATIITFACIGNVYAISKEKHQSVTDMAIKAYTSCIKERGVEDTLIDGTKLIVEATKLEDESPLMQRYFNWHFYDVYKNTEFSMGKSATGARKSLHHIYNERINSLVKSLTSNKKNEIYEFSGRLVHYIQDMTVPAHVSPIYHFKFLWIDESDHFDSMREWETATFAPPHNLCNINVSGILGLKVYAHSILDKTAKQTIERIQEIIPVPDGHKLEGKSWEEFWVLRNPKNDDSYSGVKYGFSPYGRQGRNGFEEFCKTDKDICLEFFQKSFNDAVASTVKVLLYINAVNTN